MPKRGFANSGIHSVSVRNVPSPTCAKNGIDSNTSTATMPQVIATDDIAATHSSMAAVRSLYMRQRRLESTLAGASWIATSDAVMLSCCSLAAAHFFSSLLLGGRRSRGRFFCLQCGRAKQQRIDREPDLRHAAEASPTRALRETLQPGLVGPGRQRQILHFLRQL